MFYKFLVTLDLFMTESQMSSELFRSRIKN